MNSSCKLISVHRLYAWLLIRLNIYLPRRTISSVLLYNVMFQTQKLILKCKLHLIHSKYIFWVNIYVIEHFLYHFILATCKLLVIILQNHKIKHNKKYMFDVMKYKIQTFEFVKYIETQFTLLLFTWKNIEFCNILCKIKLFSKDFYFYNKN